MKINLGATIRFPISYYSVKEYTYHDMSQFAREFVWDFIFYSFRNIKVRDNIMQKIWAERYLIWVGFMSFDGLRNG